MPDRGSRVERRRLDPRSRLTRLGIITRDSRIQQHPAEIAAIKVNNARMVALAGDEARGTWQQLEVLMRHWRAIEALATRPGPFVYTATRSQLKAVALG